MPRRSRRINANRINKKEEGKSTLPGTTLRPRPLGETSEPGSTIFKPGDTDYILGRGLAHVGHPGNAFMHDLLERFRPKYTGATTKLAKTKIVRYIYDKLSAKGRFIDKHRNADTYFVVDAATAREKISHGIRYRRRIQTKTPSATSPSSDNKSDDNEEEENPENSLREEAGSRMETTEAQVPSFSLGSGSIRSRVSWTSQRSNSNEGANNNNNHSHNTTNHVAIEGLDLVDLDQGSIASGIFSVETLQAIIETNPVLSAERFPSSPSVSEARIS